jgi:hypothetical protein
MYILIVLATMTNLGTYPTQARCEAAVRNIYEQKLDPYHLIPPETLKQVIDLQMRYSAPKEYLCRKS